MRLHFSGPINNLQHAMQILCIAVFNYASTHKGIISLAQKFSYFVKSLRIFSGEKNKIQNSLSSEISTNEYIPCAEWLLTNSCTKVFSL